MLYEFEKFFIFRTICVAGLPDERRVGGRSLTKAEADERVFHSAATQFLMITYGKSEQFVV